MKIWHSPINLELIASQRANTMIELLGIEFITVGDDYLAARMFIDHKTRQPLGIMHGGASCVLAETIGSTAANFCIDNNEQYCVGLDINTNHIHSVRTGYVIGTAKPFHLGKSTQVWGIEIVDEERKLVSISRLTMAILKK